MLREQNYGRVPQSAVPEVGRRPLPVELSAERRQLTVMFVDLVGSTALSSRLDPEDTRELVRAYQDIVAGEIAQFEGHVAKFMGDGVLAYFGWPERTRTRPSGRCAPASRSSGRGRLAAPAGERLAARVGIATGLVVVGELIGERGGPGAGGGRRDPEPGGPTAGRWPSRAPW